MTEPNLSALTKMEQLVFGADAKKDAAGNIIEQGHGNLHARVKAAEAAIKAAVPSIPVDTVTTLAANSVISTLMPPAAAGNSGVDLSQSGGVPVQPVSVVATPTPPAPATPAPAAVTVAPTPVTPAPVAAATNPEPAVAPQVAVVTAVTVPPAVATAPIPVTAETVQAAVPTAPPAVVAAVVATAHPAATHETLVARVKAFLAEAESKIEEIL